MHDFAYLLPVTVICELIGIPEADQEAVRDHTDRNLRTKPGQPQQVRENFVDGTMFAE